MSVNTLQTSQTYAELKLPPNQKFNFLISADLDNLLLAIEAIDPQAIDAILELVGQMNLDEIIPNRVSLWRLRNTNPERRNYQRQNLNWNEVKAMVVIIASIARRLNTHLRLLVNIGCQIEENKIEVLGLQQNVSFFEAYSRQFCDLFLSRMRSEINEHDLKDLGAELLIQLLFCSGSLGEQRLWNSLLKIDC